MLISTARLLDKCHSGLRSDDEAVSNAAESCLSYLIYHMKESVIVLPEHIAARYVKLPEGTHYADSNS